MRDLFRVRLFFLTWVFRLVASQHPLSSRTQATSKTTTTMASLRPTCSHFLKGSCKFGDKCKNSHAASSQSAVVKHRSATGGEGVLQKKQGGKSTTRLSTTQEMVTQADGTVTAREITVREVVWTPYSAHAGRTSGPKEAARDKFGNCKGPTFDLSPDDAFKGETIAILQLYTGEGLTLAAPRVALSRKGFKILHWTRASDCLSAVGDFGKHRVRDCSLHQCDQGTGAREERALPLGRQLPVFC